MKRSHQIKLFISFILLLVSLYSHSACYYFSTSGLDTNDGSSPSSPWLSISKINSMTISPGDKIYFKGGDTFEGNILLDSKDANDTFNPVLFTSYGTGRATIHTSGTYVNGFKASNTQGISIVNLNFKGDGNDFVEETNSGILFESTLTGSTKLSTFEVRNVEVSKFAYAGIYFHQFGIDNASGFKKIIVDSALVHEVKEAGILVYCQENTYSQKSWQCNNISIKNCETYNIPGYEDTQHRGSGILISQTDSCIIERCIAHHTGMLNSNKGGPGGIWVWSANNAVIQNCESHHNSSGTGGDGLGFDLDGGCTNCVVQYCYSHDNDGAGYLLGQYSNARPWANNIVRYNISENDSRTNNSSITVFKGDNCTFNGVKIYNNTVYNDRSSRHDNSTQAVFQITNWITGIYNVEVYNNIFQSGGNLTTVDIPSGYSAKFLSNLYFSFMAANIFKYQDQTYSGLKSWSNATNNEKLNNVIVGKEGNPKLKKPGTSILLFPKTNKELDAYQLADGSPGIGSGLNLDSLFHINIGTHDYYGTIIAPNSSHNIGAYETEQGLSIFNPFEQKLTILEITPNPSNGNFKIKFDNDENSSASATISDINGKIVDIRTTTDNFIQYSNMNLTDGIYFITVNELNITYIGKLIVR
jgi:Secretion system C-terminal sorting domain/Right handed beta helix region